MNGRFLSAGVFMALMLSSLLAGHHGYCCAKEAIAADLNQALLRTLEEKRDNFVSQDTIRAYRCLRETAKGKVLFAVADERFCRNLIDGRLRKKAFIAFDAADGHCLNGMQEAGVIAGDTMLVSDKATGDTLAIKGYVRLSAASVFSLSDQRLSFALALSALAWLLCSWVVLHRLRAEVLADSAVYGGIYYSSEDCCFRDACHMPVRLTPMQQRLLLMLWEAPSHSLAKEEICAALWPKKEDASDTLYTLVKRLKPVIEGCSDLRIVAYRGRSYSLEIKQLSDCQENVRKMSV